MKSQGARSKTGAHSAGRLRLRSAVVWDMREFTSLRQEWDDLYQSCPSATPFQSWEWLYSWWEVYGEGSYGLRLVTLRDESGLLVGLLPLMVRRGRLLFLGGRSVESEDGMTPYKDVLVREGWEEPVGRSAVQALKQMDGWQVADLQELMPEAAAWALFRYWDALKSRLPITDYVLVRANSWEELLSSLSRNLRSIARRTLRRAEQDGVRCEPAGVEEAEDAAQRLIELHREMFRGRRISAAHLTLRYETFIERAARRMTARGIGRISEFRRQDGEVLFSQFLVFDKDFVGAYMLGASQEASQLYQFNTLWIWDAMNVACTRGDAYVSLMDYASHDKLRWATEVVRSQRMILGRSKVFWGPYAGYYILSERYYALRTRAQLYVHSEDAPQWVQNATERYYELVDYVHSDDAPRWVQSATEGYYALRRRYGYGWLRYKYELARARRADKSEQLARSSPSLGLSKRQ